jgi:hypothetical protein
MSTFQKGDPIRFIAGKYSGKNGWIDLGKGEGDATIAVIVDLGKKGEKATYVYAASIEPSYYTQATRILHMTNR